LELSLRNSAAGSIGVGQTLQTRIAELDNDVVSFADKYRIAQHLLQEPVYLHAAMQFSNHDERVLVELLRHLRNGRRGFGERWSHGQKREDCRREDSHGCRVRRASSQNERPSTATFLSEGRSTPSSERTLTAAVAAPDRSLPNPKGAQPHFAQK
jgi:hypothetical protein